jgi:hypothetical protein
MELITITNEAWTIATMRADWADDDSLTGAQVAMCADLEYAWLINNTGDRLRGWSYTNGSFTGPIRRDAVTEILGLIGEAVDYVLSAMIEIMTEPAAADNAAAAPAPAESCVYHRDRPAACDAGLGWYEVSGDTWCAAALTEFNAETGGRHPEVRAAVRIA